MTKATITRDEFDRFWNEVLSDDWYIDETDIPDQWWDSNDKSDPITVELLTLGWQGTGPREPQPTTWITARDMRDGLDFFTLLERWRAGQSTVTVAVEVPREREADLLAAIKELGGRVTS
jgi:hypothetical protein